MSAPAPLRVRVCRKGADPTRDAVTITIDPSVFPRKDWGTELLALLKDAAGVAGDIERLGVWYAADGEENDLPPTRIGWTAVKSMDPADVIVVEGRREDEGSRAGDGSIVVESRRVDRVDESSVYDLPNEEQNSKRLYDLYLGGSCAVLEALQEVSRTYSLTNLQRIPHTLSMASLSHAASINQSFIADLCS